MQQNIQLLSKPIPDMTPAEREAYSLGFTSMPSDEDLITAKAVKAREEAKASRAALVADIIVTTSSGKSFNGDEESQGRMARAIIALKENNMESTTWVLADNTPAAVTVAELVEALTLAGAAQTAVWVLPTQ